MADTVHLFLKAGGEEIRGDSTQTSLGRAGSIECLSYEQNLFVPDGAPASRRQHVPLVIRKRIDRASPALLRALCEGLPVEANFRFYQPSPSGDGTTEQHHTVAIVGRIVGIKQISPSVVVTESAAQPAMEEVSFSYESLTWMGADGTTYASIKSVR